MLICFHFKKLLYPEVLVFLVLLSDVTWVVLVCENLLNFILMKDTVSCKYSVLKQQVENLLLNIIKMLIFAYKGIAILVL